MLRSFSDDLARPLAVGLCAMLAVLACGGGGSSSPAPAPADQQVLRINDGTEPNSYDPGQQTYTYEAAVGRNIFQPLLLPRADLSDVQPGAARSWDVSSDGLTYTFHLRTNATWSDGKPVTARDWVYGYKRLLNPALAAGYADPFFDGTIAGAAGYGSVDPKAPAAINKFLDGLGLSAPDDHTFVVKLAQPSGYFKWVASLWVATPIRQDVVEQAAGGAFPSSDATRAEMWVSDARTIIGNGPFKVSEIAPKDHVTLVPNNGFYGGAPRLQKLVYSFIPDAGTAFARYRTGDLDMLNVSTANVDAVRSDPKLSKHARLYPKLVTAWITFNTRVAPFDNRKVRMALAKAIDRSKLARNVMNGTVTPLPTFIPKGMPGYDNSDDAQKFDPAAARKLLSDAGVTPAQLGQFKLLTRNSTFNKTQDEFIAAQWQQNLGVTVQLDVIDAKTVTSRVRRGQFDIYGPDGWGADYPDQQDWFDIFVSSSCHRLSWGCATLDGYDELVRQADAGRNDSDRNRLYARAQKQLIDEAAVGFLYQYGEYNLIQPYVKNLSVTPIDDQNIPGDLFFSDAYITRH
jgi:oligopeptide transport system substrate-binding protein